MDWITILVFIGSTAFGAFLAIIRSEIWAKKYGTPLLWIYRLLAALPIVGSVVYYFYCADSSDVNSELTFTLIFVFVAGCLLLFATERFLNKKDVYKSSELDPIVNKFTDDADRTEIKLFGGDLNFFGEAPDKMEENNQYTHLKKKRFNRILILCEKPINSRQKMRYGKILNDMPYTRFGFYHPDLADLKVRGRISQVQGVNKLLIYTKVESKRYRAIETDTSDSDGQRYLSIWDLVWSLSEKPTESELQEYKALVN
jgi:hypothetical protein